MTGVTTRTDSTGCVYLGVALGASGERVFLSLYEAAQLAESIRGTLASLHKAAL